MKTLIFSIILASTCSMAFAGPKAKVLDKNIKIEASNPSSADNMFTDHNPAIDVADLSKEAWLELQNSKLTNALESPESDENQYYRNQLEMILEDFGLQPQERKLLSEHFKIEICDEANPDHTKGGSCWTSSNESTIRNTAVPAAKGAMKFLAYYASRSLGSKVSLLFQIRRVVIVPKNQIDGHTSRFREGVLYVGIPSRYETFGGQVHEDTTANEVFDQLRADWDSGEVVRNFPTGVRGSIYKRLPMKLRMLLMAVTGNKKGALREKLFAERWPFLNPIGIARRTINRILFKAMEERANYLEGGDPLGLKRFARDITRDNQGFTKEDTATINTLNDEELAEFNQMLSEEMNNGAIIAKVLEMLVASEDDTTNESRVRVDFRKQGPAAVSLLNNKVIEVDLTAMMASLQGLKEMATPACQGPASKIRIMRDPGGHASCEIETNASDVHVDASEQSASLVNLGLKDDVDVNVKIPSINQVQKLVEILAVKRTLHRMKTGAEMCDAILGE